MTPKLKRAIELLLNSTGGKYVHWSECSQSTGGLACKCGVEKARKIVENELRGGKK